MDGYNIIEELAKIGVWGVSGGNVRMLLSIMRGEQKV